MENIWMNIREKWLEIFGENVRKKERKKELKRVNKDKRKKR